MAISAPYTGKKVSKKSVKFGESTGRDQCGGCVHSLFKPRQNDGTCEILDESDNRIDRDDWCSRYESTEGSGTEPKGQT